MSFRRPIILKILFLGFLFLIVIILSYTYFFKSYKVVYRDIPLENINLLTVKFNDLNIDYKIDIKNKLLLVYIKDFNKAKFYIKNDRYFKDFEEYYNNIDDDQPFFKRIKSSSPPSENSFENKKLSHLAMSKEIERIILSAYSVKEINIEPVFDEVKKEIESYEIEIVTQEENKENIKIGIYEIIKKAGVKIDKNNIKIKFK